MARDVGGSRPGEEHGRCRSDEVDATRIAVNDDRASPWDGHRLRAGGVVTAELARSVECARELLDDETIGRKPVLAEWLAAQREAFDDALASDYREQVVARSCASG